MNTVQTIHPHLFTTKYLFHLFQTLPLQLIVINNYFVRFWKKYDLVYITKRWDFSFLPVFLAKCWTFCPHIFRNKSALNFFLKFTLWTIVVINYFSRVYSKFVAAYLTGSWTMCKSSDLLSSLVYHSIFLERIPENSSLAGCCW